MAEVVKDLSSRLGEPTSRSPEADADPADAPAVWLDGPCGVEVRTYKQAGEWWAGSPGTVCVQLHSVPVVGRQPAAGPRETGAAQPQTQPGAAGPIVPAVPTLEASATTSPQESLPAEAATRQPELIKESYVPPRYPLLQRGLRVETRVLLQAIVHSDGTVGDVAVLETSRPNLGFEEAAIEAVKKWRYKPGTRDGEVVDMPITVNVVFR
jgi:protein TonB